MKRRLIQNYWLIIVAWCLAICDYEILGLFVTLAATLLILKTKGMNYWRIIALSVLIFDIFLLTISHTNIPYFFDKIYLFLLGVSLNAAVINDYNYFFKPKAFYGILLIMLTSLLCSLLLLIILPNSMYTIFTKRSLCMMILSIFVPYVLPTLICVLRKIGKIVLLRKKEVTVR